MGSGRKKASVEVEIAIQVAVRLAGIERALEIEAEAVVER
jgi:hypothetical protein